MKAQASYPFSMAEAGFTFLLLIGVIYGSQGYTETFMMEEAADAQADRIKNAAMALDSMPEGHLHIDISRYEYRIDNGELELVFRDANETVNLEKDLTVERINGSKEFKELEGLCMEKRAENQDRVIDFTSKGDC